MSPLNLGRVGTPIPQKIWDVFYLSVPGDFVLQSIAEVPPLP
ncbi:MAG: hypothetical protein V7K50_13985 [Nostoc sp.]